MQTTTGAILLVIGVVALFAAIVGGGVKIKEIEVGSLPSRWRQLFLAVFGIVVGVTGLVMVMDNPTNGTSAAEPAQNSASTDQNTASSEPEATDNVTDENAGGADASASEDNNSADESGQQE